MIDHSKKALLKDILLLFFFPVLFWASDCLFPWYFGNYHHPENRNYGIPLVMSIFLLEWLCVIYVMYILKVRNLKLTFIYYFNERRKTIIFIFIYTFVAFIIYLFAEFKLSIAMDHNRKIVQNVLGPETAPERLAWIALSFSAGFCEEFIYRGFGLATLISKGLNKWIALPLTSLAFVLIHGPGVIYNLPFFAFTFIFGFILGLLLLLFSL